MRRLKRHRRDRRKRPRPLCRGSIRQNDGLKRVLGRSHDLLCRIDILLKGGELRGSGYDIDRSKNTLFYLTLITLELGLGLFECIDLHLQIAKSENEIPISLLDLTDDIDRLLTKLRIGEQDILLCDLYLPAILVDAEVTKQRLRVCRRKGRWKLRIEKRVCIAGRRSRCVKVSRVLSAAYRRKSVYAAGAKPPILGNGSVNRAADAGRGRCGY